MEIVQLTTPAEEERYERWVRAHPQGNLWQSLAWKRLQTARGKEVKIYAALHDAEIQAAALVVIDRGRGGSTWEIPRGPLQGTGDKGQGTTKALIQAIIEDAKNNRALTIFLSDSFVLSHVPCHLSLRHVHPEATVILDLGQSEEQLLAQMHQKGRYNIKVAAKHGIHIKRHEASDAHALQAFYTLVSETAKRDNFTHLPKTHYEAFLGQIEGSFLLMAWHDDVPVAGLIGVTWNGMGLYYYGASSYAHRNLMAPYLLQWEAMRLCRAKECHSYDLLGIAPVGSSSDNPWAGITGFKTKFGGTVVTYPPEQMIVLRPLQWKLLQMKRKFLG